MNQQISSGGAPRVASATLVAGAAILPAPWSGSSSCRVNGTGSLTDWCLELREGRATCCGLKKEARPEIPRQKSTISLIAAILAGAVVLLAPLRGSSWCRVNGTGSLSDQCLELWGGRVAYYGLKKEARPEIPRQKSTISLNAAV